MIFVVSDLHFNHKKICEYEPGSRGHFKSLDEMNEALISNWNSVVTNKDTIYMLGDIFMGPLEPIDDIMPRLNGNKILIRGNHDTTPRVQRMIPYLEGVYDIYNLKHDGHLIILSHYPMREWMHKEHGSIHLYGHVHSNEHRNGVLTEPNSYHIGVDTNNLTPVSIDRILEKIKPCNHTGEINSAVSTTDGHIDYYVCSDCGKIVEKCIINNKERWV